MREVFKKLYNRKIVVAAGILIVIVAGFFLYRHSNERSNEDYINVFTENRQDFECVAKVMGKWTSGSIDFDDGISSANQEIEKEISDNADFNNSLTNLYDLKEISCILIEDDAKIKKDTKGDNSQTQSVVRNANATVHDSDSDFEITLGTLFSDFTYEEETTSEVVNNRIGTVEADGKYHDWYFHDYGDISLYTTDYNEITGDMSGHNVYIMQIVLHTPRFETARGISVGARVTELKDAYWDGLIYDRREESYQYIEDGINISFYIKKGIVKEISIFYAEGRS